MEDFFILATSGDSECLKKLSLYYNFKTHITDTNPSQLLVETTAWQTISNYEKDLIQIHARGFVDGWNAKEY